MSVRTIDLAYDYLKERKQEVSFQELWSKVIEALGISAEQGKKQIAQFYYNLTIDSRFVQLDNSKWDLKSNHHYDEANSSIFADDADEDETELEDDYDEIDYEGDNNDSND